MNEIKKISLKKMKKILQKDGSVYTDEEILQIRDFLYRLADLDYQVYLKLEQRETEFKKNELTDEGIEP